MTRLKLALRLLWCCLRHDVRQRQGAWRCLRCYPPPAKGGEAVTVQEIVKAYLESNGFDGLYSPLECCCQVSDLMPCGEAPPDCEAGHELPCDPERCSGGGGCEYHIGRKP